MTRYLLDTNTCIQLLNGSSDTVVRQFSRPPPAAIILCSVVKAELLYGAGRGTPVEDNLRLLDRFFAPLPSLPFDDRCAEEYGLILAQLSTEVAPIGPNDLMIAAIARAHDATLVTHNTRGFSRVAGLRISDREEEQP